MKQNFNDGWRFHIEDANERVVNRHIYKNGFSKGYAAEDFNDAGWEDVTLPHDWCFGLEQDPEYDVTHGHYKLNIADQMCMDPRDMPEDRGSPIGWYRKSFEIPENYSDKLIYIEFDGIFRDSEIYVNGTFIGSHISGYTGMRFMIGDELYYDGRKNTIAVRVDCTQNEGWFYEGAGIYRNAYLDIRDRVSIIPGSLSVKAVPVFDGNRAVSGNVNVTCRIRNETDSEKKAVLGFTACRQSASVSISVPAYTEMPVNAFMCVEDPELWDIASPTLYTLDAEVHADEFRDNESVSFGFRTIRFDPDNGFFLNDRHLPLRGACLHQDFACVGTALTYEIHEYKIERLREMGCNAIRTAHNPPAPELLEACDKLGMLVMDETRFFGSSDEALEEMRSIVRRDMNHPSVILWSIGNEEGERQNNTNGTRIARRMIREIKVIDDSRPVTYGGNNGGQYEGINEAVDVRGFNYLHLPGYDYIEKYHADHPSQPIVGSEEGSAFYNRGETKFDTSARTVGGYDEWIAPWGSTAEGWVRYCDEHPYIAGAFMWTGFDYSGEPATHLENTVTSFGAIDLCGYPKDVYYYYKSWWRDEDELYLFPDWNREPDENVRVVVNSNLEEVELFLNGRSLGRKTMERLGHLEWNVPFEAGKIEAVGYRNGTVMKRFVRVTIGTPAKLALRVDKKPGRSGTALVTAEVLDKYGNIVPYSSDKIVWKIENGEILGLGNGDPKSYEKNRFQKKTKKRPLENFERLENGEWVPYDTTGAADGSVFKMPPMNVQFPEKAEPPFHDIHRVVINHPQRNVTFSEFRCVFDDEGGEALLVFERIEGFMRIELNGSILTDAVQSGYPQPFRVNLREGKNEIRVNLNSHDSLEAIKLGVFIERFEEPEMLRRAYHGLCMAAIHVTGESAKVMASAEKIDGDMIEILR